MNAPSYARARLWTGISGVGSLVLIVSTLLLWGAPQAWLTGRGGTLATDAAWLAGMLALGSVLALPFDWLGGYALPRRYGRPYPRPARFVASWSRGVLVLIATTTSSGALLLAAGRAGGLPAAVATFVGLAVALVLIQEPLARWVGGLRRARGSERGAMGIQSSGLILLRGADPGFSGGFSGLTQRLVLPEHWARSFEPRALELLVERRRRILRSGAWAFTLILAIGWNVLGFVLATFLPGAGVASLAELVTTVLGFTLWTFVGLLLLPTPSRRATLAADALVTEDARDWEQLASAVQTLDRLQDDEPERTPELESVFHPIPSVQHRLAARAGDAQPRRGAWHLARTALYLSHAGLSQLPRLVHCNVGRPELWVYLPSDG